MVYRDGNDEKEVYEYTYDKNNHIVSEKIKNNYKIEGTETVDEVRNYDYDVNGRLIKSVVTNNKTDDVKESEYEYDKVGNKVKESINDEVTIDSQGTAQTKYYYDDFGDTTAKGNFKNEICYTGGIYDDTTGLYYLNARYYSPEDGNFMSQDTYRGEYTNPATLNYYGYCNGNPINYVDPSGHDAVFLKSNFVNSYIGHLGLAVQASNKKWRYFTWDTRGWHNEILYMDVSDAIKKGKVYAGINALTMRFTKKLIYTDYIYIKGDFSRSSFYIKKYKKNNKRKGTEYGLTSKNCAWMAIEIFSKGRLSAKKRGQLEKMQWKYNYVPFKKQYIKQRKTIIPNVTMKQLAKIFSVSSRKVRTKR